MTDYRRFSNEQCVYLHSYMALLMSKCVLCILCYPLLKDIEYFLNFLIFTYLLIILFFFIFRFNDWIIKQ